MRVATWNLWWRFGENWAARHESIEATLRTVDADIICCQEVWAASDGRDQAASLAERLGMHLAHRPRFGKRGEAFSNAVLSRTPIRHCEVHSLEIAGESAHRTALIAQIDRDGQHEGEHATVICTHLEHRFHMSAIRQGQVRTLCELAAPHHDPEAFPVILAGDFNAVPTSDEIRLLTGERPPPVDELVWSDAWPQRGDGPGFTWSGRNALLAEAMWPNRRLDYVFVAAPRPAPRGNVVRAELFGTEPLDGVMPSDHFGLVVDLVD